MKRAFTTGALLVVLAAGAAQAQAQQKASSMNMTVMGMSAVYNINKAYLLKTAEQVPAEMYSYKPTPEVRSLGAILGHVADSQKMFCAVAEGKAQPNEDAGSDKLTDKAAIIKVLQDSFSYCDAVIAKTTDADLMAPRTIFGMKMNVAGVLTLNTSHDGEHYGNLVTYMRLNKMVPPSSQGN